MVMLENNESLLGTSTDIFLRNRSFKDKPPLWDSFQDPPAKRVSGSSASWAKLSFFLKFLKLITYIAVCIIVLMSAVVSKLSFILMVVQIRKGRTVKICNISDPTGNYVATLPSTLQISWVWALIFAFSVPELLTFLRALRLCIFKDIKAPSLAEACFMTASEILHVVGLALLTFIVLPYLDAHQAMMVSSCVCFIPAAINIFKKPRRSSKSLLVFSASVIALIFQFVGFIVWPANSESVNVQIMFLPLILVSFRWWENYIYSHPILANCVTNKRRSMSRYYTYLYLSPIKVITFAFIGFSTPGILFVDFFRNFTSAWNIQEISVKKDGIKNMDSIESDPLVIVYVMVAQIVSAYVCYIFAKFACKIKIQRFSFSLPLVLATPLSVASIILLSEFRESEACLFNEYFPSYLTFNKYSSPVLESVLNCDLWLFLFLWISQIWISRHIWFSKNEKNSSTEKLFICPWYCGLMVEQCISLNRRIDDWNNEFLQANTALKKHSTTTELELLESDPIQLIICATMWHETQEEMMEFLKSIIRLDEDQCARRMAKLYINGGEPDDGYYELETNIFFDDAFILDEKLCENPKNPPLNDWVKLLITSIEKAAFEIYGVNMRIKPPVKIETPYGGRLVWSLPGRTKLIAHLKNKDKIRHKKRWSQVMYMYYLLGFRIMELEDILPKRKAKIADNTFILALDGDIDFQPHAVQLLLDRMKVIDELGAACGRIHPVGRGPMVWYQTFEYAIGHWLQKATEHVIGCVLCSPGCFSLFRGSALMENSVMKKYTTVATEPLHYVQYDQGEDRWLCTLLLKQGMRVEYSAASDAYTHAPESFNEFFNQRRRWVPSTIANIFDMLADSEVIVKNNSSISRPYIAYQGMLIVGTILGPGTIFLMMVGALVTVFSINIWTAFLWNFFPVLGFMLSCIYLKQKHQLLIAFIISSVYCLVMMAVLIGLTIQMIEDGLLAPASIFFLLVAGQIVVAGLMHPQEVGALICGIIYYVTIPSMYMLLMIYSVFNMNDISWGTREIAPKPEDNNTTAALDGCESNNYLPGWMNDPLLVDSELGEISLREKRFWKDLIKLYLKPLFHTKEKKTEIANNLRELRNIFTFAFVMTNSLFVLIVFLLQLQKDLLHINWPIDPIDTITYDNTDSEIFIHRAYKEVDPIGLCFVVFFGSILVIQFIAMLFHRFGTFSHLMATTELNWFRSTDQVSDEDAVQEIRGNAVNIARQLQRPKRFDDDGTPFENNYSSESEDFDGMIRRSTVFKLHIDREQKENDYSDLARNFERRFYSDDDIVMKNISMSRKSVMMLNETRSRPSNLFSQPSRHALRNKRMSNSTATNDLSPTYEKAGYIYDNISYIKDV